MHDKASLEFAVVAPLQLLQELEGPIRDTPIARELGGAETRDEIRIVGRLGRGIGSINVQPRIAPIGILFVAPRDRAIPSTSRHD